MYYTPTHNSGLVAISLTVKRVSAELLLIKSSRPGFGGNIGVERGSFVFLQEK